MAAVGSDLENVELVGERELWLDGPPHELFKRLRGECPVHWTERIERIPGGGRLLVGDDRRGHPHGQPRLAHLLLGNGRRHGRAAVFPLELTRAMFIGMDPPKHDRLKALFQAGFTPKRIAAHEDAIRQIVDRRCWTVCEGRESVRPRRRRRPARRVARDRQLHGHPRGGRRDVGAADELDARRRATSTSTPRASTGCCDKTSPRSSSAAGG